MTLHSMIENDCLSSSRAAASRLAFYPRGTVRCVGTPLFRSQLARDLGCLLDVDRHVKSWSCLPTVFSDGADAYLPDFLVQRTEGAFFIDAAEAGNDRPPRWIRTEIETVGYSHEVLTAEQIHSGFRLENARDLLRYARWQTPLGDRVRLLAALDELGSMSVADCLPVFREVPPISGLSSLVLHRFVDIELDEERIGPETTVRRCRD